ncbi:MAG: polysaccharide deacetylase family protein, partial [Candidatus Dadabacteria bacterium]|nr:polysaccharide deacetylase family protein [Candidatus Dadabacteria bacterium]
MYDPSGIPVLCYHSIDPSNSVISVSPESFAAQMRHLKKLGYQSISLNEIVNYVHKGVSNFNRPIGIIFDDGYRNNYTKAFPVLQEVGYTATIFVTTGYCGKFNEWGAQNNSIPRLPMMTWEEISEMSRNGIEIGSHTKSHPKLAELDELKAREELIGAKKQIEDHIGREVEFASYPFGSFNDEVKQVAKTAFKAVVSTRVGKVRVGSDVHALERINTSGKLFKMLPPKIIFSGSLDYFITLKNT